MNPFLPWCPNAEEVEKAEEVTENFAVSEPTVQVSATLDNVPASVTVIEHSTSVTETASGTVAHSSSQSQPTGAIPKKKRDGASADLKSTLERTDPMPIIKDPTEESSASKAFWEETGAVPKVFTKEYAEIASKYLPPFRKPKATKSKTEPLTEVPIRSESSSPQSSKSLSPSSISHDSNLLPRSKSPPEGSFDENSSRSERAQFVRHYCLDFQDYKRTVNTRQKGLEQSLNLVLPKMNSAMVDAQKLAAKIERVRSQVCDSEETLKIQNDKMKYLVGRTVGTIAKIDGLFDKFRVDILDYTSLTTEGNEGIDRRLSKLLKILCGVEHKDLGEEKVKVIREAFSEEESEKKN